LTSKFGKQWPQIPCYGLWEQYQLNGHCWCIDFQTLFQKAIEGGDLLSKTHQVLCNLPKFPVQSPHHVFSCSQLKCRVSHDVDGVSQVWDPWKEGGAPVKVVNSWRTFGASNGSHTLHKTLLRKIKRLTHFVNIGSGLCTMWTLTHAGSSDKAHSKCKGVFSKTLYA